MPNGAAAASISDSSVPSIRIMMGALFSRAADFLPAMNLSAARSLRFFGFLAMAMFRSDIFPIYKQKKPLELIDGLRVIALEDGLAGGGRVRKRLTPHDW